MSPILTELTKSARSVSDCRFGGRVIKRRVVSGGLSQIPPDILCTQGVMTFQARRQAAWHMMSDRQTDLCETGSSSLLAASVPFGSGQSSQQSTHSCQVHRREANLHYGLCLKYQAVNIRLNIITTSTSPPKKKKKSFPFVKLLESHKVAEP